MINLYNKHYVKTMNKYKDIMDTICTITLTKLPTQTEAPIFKINVYQHLEYSQMMYLKQA